MRRETIISIKVVMLFFMVVFQSVMVFGADAGQIGSELMRPGSLVIREIQAHETPEKIVIPKDTFANGNPANIRSDAGMFVLVPKQQLENMTRQIENLGIAHTLAEGSAELVLLNLIGDVYLQHSLGKKEILPI